MNKNNKTQINSVSIFVNALSPFSVLNGLCTGNVELQVILGENNHGLWVVEMELLNTIDIIFSGNKIEFPTYKEISKWEDQVNKLFNCNINKLMFEDAKKNIDLREVEYKLSCSPRILLRYDGEKVSYI
jgi:hypothetical protein